MEARLTVARLASGLALGAVMLVAGCDQTPERKVQAESKAVTAGTPIAASTAPAGVTPMAERVAVLGLLNKRNGIVRDLTMNPGQAIRIKDTVVRLRACETTPPWEQAPLTGAFVQLDRQLPDGSWIRRFSGWLYKESPSLNVVEDAVYDVWPKSCTMTFPGGVAATPTTSGSGAASKASSAKKSPGAQPAATVVPAVPAAPAAPEPSAVESNSE